MKTKVEITIHLFRLQRVCVFFHTKIITSRNRMRSYEIIPSKGLKMYFYKIFRVVFFFFLYYFTNLRNSFKEVDVYLPTSVLCFSWRNRIFNFVVFFYLDLYKCVNLHC